MTNEEKARELAFESPQCQMYIDNKCTQNFACDRFKVALEMAEWKDEQHKQKKQQWIEKACEWIKKEMIGLDMGKYPMFSPNFINDFKKAMKGE